MAEQNIGSFDMVIDAFFSNCTIGTIQPILSSLDPHRALAWQRSNSRSPGSHPSAGTSTCRLGSLQPVSVIPVMTQVLARVLEFVLVSLIDSF